MLRLASARRICKHWQHISYGGRGVEHACYAFVGLGTAVGALIVESLRHEQIYIRSLVATA